MANYSGQPDCKKLVYKLNSETRYYERISSPLGFEKLPTELKVEETQRKEQINSRLVCRGRIRGGTYTFFTGLLPVESNSRFYFGDHYHPKEKQKNSFILFQFSEGNEYLTVYYFNHFKVYPSKRGEFISGFLRRGLIETEKGGDKPTSLTGSNSILRTTEK